VTNHIVKEELKKKEQEAHNEKETLNKEIFNLKSKRDEEVEEVGKSHEFGLTQMKEEIH
jgi:hypothetical protein